MLAQSRTRTNDFPGSRLMNLCLLGAWGNAVVVAVLSLLLAGCPAHYSPIYWDYGEWNAPDAASADRSVTVSLDWSTEPGVIQSIDAVALGKGYKKAKLRPGRHRLEYASYPAEFGAHPQGNVDVDLLAGHAYEFGMKLCFWCTPRRYAVWVIDTTTGDLVWGKRPDWPSWYL